MIPLKDLWDIAKEHVPKSWKNNTSVFEVPEMRLLFKCNGRDLGGFNVWVYNQDEEVAYMQGTSNDAASVPVEVGSNRKKMNVSLLWEMFHMARCYREFERTEDIRFKRGFEFFRERAIRLLQQSRL